MFSSVRLIVGADSYHHQNEQWHQSMNMNCLSTRDIITHSCSLFVTGWYPTWLHHTCHLHMYVFIVAWIWNRVGKQCQNQCWVQPFASRKWRGRERWRVSSGWVLLIRDRSELLMGCVRCVLSVVSMSVSEWGSVCIYVCVCVWEREREKEWVSDWMSGTVRGSESDSEWEGERVNESGENV